MKVYVVTDTFGNILKVMSTRKSAIDAAEELETSGDYPVDSIFVDEYSVED